jgi:hypothetical protein
VEENPTTRDFRQSIGLFGVVIAGPGRAGFGASQYGMLARSGDRDVTAVPVGRSPTNGLF